MSYQSALSPLPLEVKDLSAWLQRREEEPFLLLDVREADEYQICHIEGARLLPLSKFPIHLENSEQFPIVVYCHHGVRSRHAGEFLLHAGQKKVFNLEGGIDVWAQEVDPIMARY